MTLFGYRGIVEALPMIIINMVMMIINDDLNVTWGEAQVVRCSGSLPVCIRRPFVVVRLSRPVGGSCKRVVAAG